VAEKNLQENLPLSEAELAYVKKIAKRDGISEDQAASNLVKAALARRAKKRGGAGGRVLPTRRR
jgi:hypothetical protein